MDLRPRAPRRARQPPRQRVQLFQESAATIPMQDLHNPFVNMPRTTTRTQNCHSSSYPNYTYCDHPHRTHAYRSHRVCSSFTNSTFIIMMVYAFFTCHSVLSMEVPWRYQVDLIDSLSLHNTTHGGVRVIPGPDYAIRAIELYGNRRRLQLSSHIYKKTARILSSSKDFAILATVRQKELNSGTIVSISSGNTRFLEVQSSGRKNEIRLHYTSSKNEYGDDRRVFIETFPYRLADNRWHKIAIIVSGNQLELWVNCTRIYSRVVPRRVDHKLQYDDEHSSPTAGLLLSEDSKNYSLWLGQRNDDQHFVFQGALQDVKIVAHEHGHLLQCPQLEAECPTCGQFQQLQESMSKMENFVQELAAKLTEAQQRISDLEQCECSISCKFNGTVIRDGATWQESCELCSCVRGEVVCRPMNCPAVFCKNPVTLPGECCPKCLRKCYIQQRTYEHGEQFSIPSNPCTICKCQNGRMKCEPKDRNKVCPRLACPAHVQVQPEGECCKTCPDCSYGHDCHANATCVSLNTKYTCLCKDGFTGSGKQCTDIDECETKGGRTGNHCQRNAECVNTPGSYQCACLPGYRRQDAWNCIDENECATGIHDCTENTVCVNDEGSFHCKCAPGYKGDGINCEPVCNSPCSPGGRCVAPNTCTCRQGYVGSNCDIDVDECADRLHQCDNNSVCVNMPGWYYCECQEGYRRKVQQNSLLAQCEDINECVEDSHTCLSPAKCVNTLGSYRCECPNQRHGSSSCSLGCFYEGEERRNGESWEDKSDTCKQCECRNGIAKCNKLPCNCHAGRYNDLATRSRACCSNCDRNSQCKHQETPQVFRSGQRWIYQCQVCECLRGEIDCWEMKCPPLSCENPVYKEGFCCPVCPDSEVCKSTNNSTQNQSNCFDNGVLYRHGEQLRMEGDTCTNCKCKIPFCDNLVSNMAININRMDGSVVLLLLIVTFAITLGNRVHDVIQDSLLLVLNLRHGGMRLLLIVLKAIQRYTLKLVKLLTLRSLVSFRTRNTSSTPVVALLTNRPSGRPCFR